MYRVDGKPFPTVTDGAIRGFFGEYRWLSNFELATIEVEHLPGFKFASVEHAYMASKTDDPQSIARLSVDGGLTPKQAKAFGQKVTLRSNWNIVRYRFMKDCVHAKFTQHQDLGKLLIGTEDRWLEESNDWGDTYWGRVDDVGQNNLGYILMSVREELKKQEALKRESQRQSELNQLLAEVRSLGLAHAVTADADKAELDYLRYFYQNADFGPAHEDVVDLIRQGYSRAGKSVPEGYGVD